MKLPQLAKEIQQTLWSWKKRIQTRPLPWCISQITSRPSKRGLGWACCTKSNTPKALGWSSGRHNPGVNLPRPLEKITRGIYNLVSLKTLLGRLTLENGILKGPIWHCFYASAKAIRSIIVWTLPQNFRLRSTLCSIYTSTKRYFS